MKKKIYRKYMLRPLIYMTATRFMAALIFLLAITRFVENGAPSSVAAGFLALLFALFAYLVYLRMDGLRIPRMKHFKSKKKKDVIRYDASMTDHIDDDAPVSFDELEEEERDWVSFTASLLNFIVYIILSFLI